MQQKRFGKFLTNWHSPSGKSKASLQANGNTINIYLVWLRLVNDISVSYNDHVLARSPDFLDSMQAVAYFAEDGR